MAKAAVSVRPDLLYADPGYDAEWVHAHCADWGVMGVIKPVKHKAEGPPGGLYRSQMTDEALKDLGYGTHWQVESFMSGMKRTMGSVLNAWAERGLMTDAALKVLALRHPAVGSGSGENGVNSALLHVTIVDVGADDWIGVLRCCT